MKPFALLVLFFFCCLIAYVLMNIFVTIAFALVKVVAVLFIAAIIWVALLALFKRCQC